MQSCLALNRDKLIESAIDYPFHESLKKASKGKFTNGNGAEFLNIIRDYNFKTDQVLFSNEGLFARLPASPQFFDLIGSKQYHLKIIVYTRNLFSHAFSNWLQQIKAGKTSDDINTYLFGRPNGPHARLLEWIELSSKFDFDLSISNYSKRSGGCHS